MIGWTTPRSVGSEKSKLTRAARRAGTSMTNAKTAKRLRKIARGLDLDSKTEYRPSQPVHAGYFSAPEGRRCERLGSLPPFVMAECTRRAYKEAKKIYAGKPLTRLEPKPAEIKR